MFKEKTLELEHNQDKYFFLFLIFLYLNIKIRFSGFCIFSLYVFFVFAISFFLRDHNGNKAVQIFCAIPLAIFFFIVFGNSRTILHKKTFLYLFEDRINLPNYISTYTMRKGDFVQKIHYDNCFLFYEKHFFDFTTKLYGTMLFFNTLILTV